GARFALAADRTRAGARRGPGRRSTPSRDQHHLADAPGRHLPRDLCPHRREAIRSSRPDEPASRHGAARPAAQEGCNMKPQRLLVVGLLAGAAGLVAFLTLWPQGAGSAMLSGYIE